jgi:hypothetical protein
MLASITVACGRSRHLHVRSSPICHVTDDAVRVVRNTEVSTAIVSDVTNCFVVLRGKVVSLIEMLRQVTVPTLGTIYSWMEVKIYQSCVLIVVVCFNPSRIFFLPIDTTAIVINI